MYQWYGILDIIHLSIDSNKLESVKKQFLLFPRNTIYMTLYSFS